MLLKADCGFGNLLKQKVLDCKAGYWKINSPSQTAPYRCEFFIEKNNLRCLKSFQVFIKDGKHWLFENNIKCLLSSCNDEDKKYIQEVLVKCVP